MLSSLRSLHLKTRILNPLDELWDRRLGVHTVGFLPAIGKISDPDWRAHYVPTRYGTLFRILRQVGIGPDDVFVDYGSGLGRVVFAAGWLGAKRSIGVEIDPPLCAGAEENRRTCRLDAKRIQFECVSAERFRPVDVSVVYLFHPFGAGTLQSVLDNLEAEVAIAPRRVRIAYENPIHANVIDAMPRWRRTATWPPGSRFTRPYTTMFWERPTD